MALTAVVHLVRRANGPQTLAMFLESYRRYPAGREHELLLLCKGFDAAEPFSEYAPLLHGLPHTCLFVPDAGFDLGAYRLALQRTEFAEYCFLNSFSTLLASDWLAKLSNVLHQPGVGLVGATGSFESTYENLRAEIRSIRGLFRRRKLRAFLRLASLWRRYPPFPNPTIRTNAFLARRDLLLETFTREIHTKEDALDLEGGRRSLTRQVQARGLRTLVVGRDGVGYEPAEWPHSRTFRLQDQENLLVADNQTERYAKADEPERRWLAQLAWGE
ncbi:MAG: hypothetical protein U0939_04395 [Pirellulales bacterium]